MGAIIRQNSQVVAVIANGVAISQAIDMRPYVMGLVHMPAIWTAASIGFKVSPTEGGTYVALYDKNATLVQISSPAVDLTYVFPAEVAGCLWIKLWSQDGAASDTNQGAERELKVDFKS